MSAMSLLQEAPNTSLVWLFYILLVFLLLVIVVGALTSREKTESVSKSESETEASIVKPNPSGKVKRLSSRKKSK